MENCFIRMIRSPQDFGEDGFFVSGEEKLPLAVAGYLLFCAASADSSLCNRANIHLKQRKPAGAGQGRSHDAGRRHFDRN
jgi:hypothetical protein